MDLLSYKLGKEAGGGSTPNLQNKDVTITQNGETTVQADAGYDGLSSVDITTNVSSGPDLSEYFNNTITNTTSNTHIGDLVLKKIPSPIYISSSTTDLSGLFQNTKITTVPRLIGGENVTLFVSMFNAINNFNNTITSCDVSGLVTSNATNMNRMFAGLTVCTQITGLTGFNTEKVTTMQSLFDSCEAITELDLSSFTNSNGALTKTSSMFSGCKNLRKIDIRGLTFSSVTSFISMFGVDTSTSKVPNNCLIIVKDNTEKTWITTNFSRMNNVKTVAEYEA